MTRWPQWSHCSTWPPRAAVRQRARALRVRRWLADKEEPYWARKAAPCWRMMSATSRGGRAHIAHLDPGHRPTIATKKLQRSCLVQLVLELTGAGQPKQAPVGLFRPRRSAPSSQASRTTLTPWTPGGRGGLTGEATTRAPRASRAAGGTPPAATKPEQGWSGPVRAVE